VVRVDWQNARKSLTQNMHNELVVHSLDRDQEHPLDFLSTIDKTNENMPKLSVSPSSTFGGGQGAILISD